MKRFVKYLALPIIFLIANPLFCHSQDKASVRIDLSYHQLNNGLPSLEALIRTRIDRRYQPVEGLNVNFYVNSAEEDNLLGAAQTDADGKARLQLGADFKMLWDSTAIFTFVASISDNPEYEDNDDEIEITKGQMTIELVEDEGRQVKVQINKFLEDGSAEPVEEVYVKLQVKRTFGSLPIGDESSETDEDGEFVSDFPDDIPGDSQGNLTIIAYVEDDDALGYLKVEKEAPWGTIVEDTDSFGERSLWATADKAPYWLLIFPNLIILGIWGTMVYLIVLIFRINKIGKTS